MSLRQWRTAPNAIARSSIHYCAWKKFSKNSNPFKSGRVTGASIKARALRTVGVRLESCGEQELLKFNETQRKTQISANHSHCFYLQ
jgi:hypothetical protein